MDELGRVPEEIRNALAFAAHEANRLMVLNNGETALFWHLVAVIGDHVGEG